ncbi:MAG: zinc-ribbon domain-containing protein [Bacillota bacterium]
MIIFGWGYRTAKNFGPVRKIRCNNCNNEATWHLQKLTSWFTLFFIPVIPYQSNYLLVCPVCRCCLELKKPEFDQLKDLVEGAGLSESQQASVQMDSILTEAGGVVRTETQLNFIRQMKELEEEKEKRNSLNN